MKKNYKKDAHGVPTDHYGPQRTGSYRQPYSTSLQEANPEKINKKKNDWWAQECKKYGEKNYFPRKD